VYHEKLYIAKHHLVLQGENREKTIITGSIAAVIYGCEHPGDMYSGVVNLDGNDITIVNLTIENTYGLNAPDSVQIDCMNRETHQSEKRTVRKGDHQFALRSFKSTRLKVMNCILRAWGNDTVSPWNSESGMYYFKDCVMQGGVDFYCPRGWSYAENCSFTCLNPNAAIWHDGHADRKMKSVFRNCHFNGPAPYKLGRYHHESLFYLLDCSFDKNMADAPIYKAATAKEVFWDSKAYYYNCHRAGGDFEWFKNNLDKAPGAPSPPAISVQWTFDGKWNPIQ
jgi:pectinesterase